VPAEWANDAKLALNKDQLFTCMSDKSLTMDKLSNWLKEAATDCQLLSIFGSRSIAWRCFLGLIPSGEKSKITWQSCWVTQTRKSRQEYSEKQKLLSIKVMAKNNKKSLTAFNPLAVAPPKNSEANSAQESEKAMRQLIE